MGVLLLMLLPFLLLLLLLMLLLLLLPLLLHLFLLPLLLLLLYHSAAGLARLPTSGIARSAKKKLLCNCKHLSLKFRAKHQGKINLFHEHTMKKAKHWHEQVMGESRKGHGWVAGGSRVIHRGRWVVDGLASPSFCVLDGSQETPNRNNNRNNETTFRAYRGPDDTQGKKPFGAPHSD